MLFAGVDIGSTTSKCVLIDENENEQVFRLTYTEHDRNASGDKVMAMALEKIGAKAEDIACTVATGYGRKVYEVADENIPEIIAHALGTIHIDPEARTIIDIGGQDSKVIHMYEKGNVTHFEMNDKCAAGTGRFFEVLTHRLLGIELEELSDVIQTSTEPCTISSMCTIFAESEIIGLLSQKKKKEDVAAGTALSIVRRVLQMGRTGRVPFEEKVVFSGGAANNDGIAKLFSENLGMPVYALPKPQSAAALGAALKAKKIYMGKKA